MRPRKNVPAAAALAVGVAATGAAHTLELGDGVDLDTTATAVVQHGSFDASAVDDATRAVATTDVGLGIDLSERDRLFTALSVATGNGLNAIVPFAATPYADDLEDDLRDIGGRGRSWLLEAWYRRGFALSSEVGGAVTAGIVDSTGFVDANAHANDEVGQFMNGVFVNNPLLNLPSYDVGVGATADSAGGWSVSAVWMNTRNSLDRSYHYGAAEVARRVDTALGEGNYRLTAFTTSDDFAAPAGRSLARLAGFGVSLDQSLGDAFGVFARVGWQDDAASVTHDLAVSGGLALDGASWGRPGDTAGFGYAWLDGANAGVEQTRIAEAYVRFAVTANAALTLDVQHVDEERVNAPDPSGWIAGVRTSLAF